jgi:hypothetical protein
MNGLNKEQRDEFLETLKTDVRDFLMNPNNSLMNTPSELLTRMRLASVYHACEAMTEAERREFCLRTYRETRDFVGEYAGQLAFNFDIASIYMTKEEFLATEQPPPAAATASKKKKKNKKKH